MKVWLLFLLLTLSFLAFSQQGTEENVRLHFTPMIGDAHLVLNQRMETSAGAEVSIQTLRFYLSNVRLFAKGNEVYTEPSSFHLLDASEPSSMILELPESEGLKYDRIEFTLGLDSVTNVSGVFEGDLDPTKGMYWTWQSGYIHFKLEGQFTDSEKADDSFSYHLGGYRSPHATCQSIGIELPEAVNSSPSVHLSLDGFLSRVMPSEQRLVMSPGAKARDWFETAALTFPVHE